MAQFFGTFRTYLVVQKVEKVSDWCIGNATAAALLANGLAPYRLVPEEGGA